MWARGGPWGKSDSRIAALAPTRYWRCTDRHRLRTRNRALESWRNADEWLRHSTRPQTHFTRVSAPSLPRLPSGPMGTALRKLIVKHVNSPYPPVTAGRIAITKQSNDMPRNLHQRALIAALIRFTFLRARRPVLCPTGEEYPRGLQAAEGTRVCADEKGSSGWEAPIRDAVAENETK